MKNGHYDTKQKGKATGQQRKGDKRKNKRMTLQDPPGPYPDQKRAIDKPLTTSTRRTIKWGQEGRRQTNQEQEGSQETPEG